MIHFDDVWITLAATYENSTLIKLIRDFDNFIAGLLLQIDTTRKLDGPI